VINALLVAVSEEQLRSNLRGDLPLVILGSIIAAIGVAALVVHLSRWRSNERVLLWFGLFAGPYGLRLLTNTIPFQMAFGEPQGVWPYVSKLVEFATLVPAMLLFEDFYGKGLAFVRPLVDRGLCRVCHDCVYEHRDYGPTGPLPNSWHRNCFPLAGGSPAGTCDGIQTSARARQGRFVLGIAYSLSDIRTRSHCQHTAVRLARGY